jgi:hypothetical protein
LILLVFSNLHKQIIHDIEYKKSRFGKWRRAMKILQYIVCAVLIMTSSVGYGAYYRGTQSLLPLKTGEFKCTATTRRGVSLDSSLTSLTAKVPAFANDYTIVGTLNTTRLKIEQQGTNPTHYEIMPNLAECAGPKLMDQATYETLLRGITLNKGKP